MKKKIVFMCNSVTLAHPVRVTLLANMLPPEKYDVIIYRSTDYGPILPYTPLSIHPIKSINTQDFINRLFNVEPVFDTDTVRIHAEEDYQVLDTEKPDLVIGDFRLTLQVTARQRSVPYLNLTGAIWDPLFGLKFESPPARRLNFLPDRVKAWVMNNLPRVAFSTMNQPLNLFRKQNGMVPYNNDPRPLYTDADYNAYCDLPVLFNPPSLDPTRQFIGPVLWAPDMPAPDLSSLRANGKYTVYINLGSSGNNSILEPLCAKLAEDDINLVVATGRESTPTSLIDRADTIVMPYLASDKISSQVDAVICNGGMPTACTALLNNAYCVGVVSNLDQIMGMRLIEEKGAGRRFRNRPFDIDAIVSTIKSRPKLSPDIFQTLTDNYNKNHPDILFPQWIDQILSE